MMSMWEDYGPSFHDTAAHLRSLGFDDEANLLVEANILRSTHRNALRDAVARITERTETIQSLTIGCSLGVIGMIVFGIILLGNLSIA